MNIKRWRKIAGATVCGFFALVSGAVIASPCTEKPAIDAWVKTYASGLKARSTMLDEIGLCIAALPDTRPYFDFLANLGLKMADGVSGLPGEQRENFVRFNTDLLWVLAKSGFASSQHNLAAIHNAQPGTIAQKAIRQDQLIFVYWTRKAAAQGEPRSLFNLAMRFSRGLPSSGIAQDRALAYQLFLQISRINAELNGALDSLMPAVQEEKKTLLVALGSSTAALLEQQDLNFSMLAPAGKFPGDSWDSVSNVKESVLRYYKLQTTSGNEAAWTWQQKCYADVLGLRTYSKEHEACVAFDIANTQLTLAFFQRMSEAGQKNMPAQYQRDTFISRLIAALVQAGLTQARAAEELDQINNKVGPASAEAADQTIKSRQ